MLAIHEVLWGRYAVYSQEWLKRMSYTKKGFKFFSKEDYISDGKKAGFSKVIIEEIVNGKSYLIKYVKQPCDAIQRD